ncbi:NlpC/P60 family protein [Streptomyces griseoaurantiacus]|uniref:C40 family peptidase n=1 Tax=Streptomyces griseoaurantiacus TaxID=68213 RepID=UPI00345FADAC
MGSGQRSLTTAAIALVCAVTVLSAPGTAFASASAPKPPPAPSSGGQGGGDASADAKNSADGGSTDGSSAGTPPTSTEDTATDAQLEAVQEKLDKLYHQAAVATDAYNAAEEKAESQSARIAELNRQIDAAKAKLGELQDRAGAAARAQYRGGTLPPEMQLWLSEDPQKFLDGAQLARQGQQATMGLIDELKQTKTDLGKLSSDASDRYEKLEANRKEKASAKKRVKKRIAAAETLQDQLEAKEKERLAKLEEEAARQAQTDWLDSGVLKDVNTKASAAGREAVAFATDQIGKPYVWGAEGPNSYDCSGLTSQAWLAAGHAIPRTSQEQWKRLPHVALADMRPGDLIIYFEDASHVAMYLGDGKIVHAPRPGRTVTIAGAGTMPILGVVRPDA